MENIIVSPLSKLHGDCNAARHALSRPSNPPPLCRRSEALFAQAIRAELRPSGIHCSIHHSSDCRISVVCLVRRRCLKLSVVDIFSVVCIFLVANIYLSRTVFYQFIWYYLWCERECSR